MDISKAHNEQTQGMRELFARSFFVGLDQARCRLLVRDGEPPLFLVELTLGEECVSAPVGSVLSRAAELFDLLVNGTVTPCVFEDVLCDLGILMPLK